MNNKTMPDLKQKNLIEKINEIKILSKEKEDSIDHRKKEKNKNIVSQIYSVKIIGKIKEGNKIVSNNKLEILPGKKNIDNISKKNKIETNPRYLKYKNGINIKDFLLLIFISKKDNNLYSVSYCDCNCSNFKYNYNIYKIDLKSKLTKKLVSLSLDYYIYGCYLKYFFNDKNNNEYLMNICDKYPSFIGIIIIDITNNFKINYKINAYKEGPHFSISNSLLVFPQNNYDNYVIFECYYSSNESLNHNKLYSFENGKYKFIKNINTSPKCKLNTLISWYNRKDKNNYIIQYNSEGTIIFNLFEDIYDVLTSSYLADNNIYNIKDLDCVLCFNKRDFEIWNLYSKQLFKKIKLNARICYSPARDMIQWNDKYLIYRSNNIGTISIFDIENEIASQICLNQNQSSGESLPDIIGVEKIVYPEHGESLIVISGKNNSDTVINLLSLK